VGVRGSAATEYQISFSYQNARKSELIPRVFLFRIQVQREQRAAE